ncbi:glycosyltransferase [Pseudocolwellia agarivorans]|uniref:glycosyltransferase n=1 Tax=Pseudocolwellia agarivorans TaxID=1911682 RepID=UPI000984FC3E|nr:glycosyltransferase [Pseudocolwellia agarivorans]
MSLTVIAWPKRKNENENPYQSLLYSSLELNNDVKVVEFSLASYFFTRGKKVLHIHWPDVFLATSQGVVFWIKLLFLWLVFFHAKLFKIPVIWTVHNLKRSEQRNGGLMDDYFWPRFSQRVDALIYMTKASKARGEEIFNNWKKIPNIVIPHGHYDPVIKKYMKTMPTIKNDKPHILFFGSIAKYKNAYKLLDAFLELPSGTSILKIKGKMCGTSPDKNLIKKLSSLSSEQQNDIIFENRFLDDKELIQAISETELVVFPYSDVLNSGAAIFALSVGRPILASNTSLFRELQSQVGENWVQLIDGELDGNQLSIAIKNSCKLKETGKQPNLSTFEWDNIAEQTLSFYRNVLDKGSKNKV